MATRRSPVRVKAKTFKKPKPLKMSKRSEKALTLSIEHWYRVRDEYENVDRDECALCEIYYDDYYDYEADDDVSCTDCPVYRKTKNRYCNKTPFIKYYKCGDLVSERTRKKYAQAEIEFLQSCYY